MAASHRSLSAHALAEIGVGITHHFGGGVYMKQTDIPVGVSLTQHVHKFDHLSVLCSGRVSVTVDDVTTEHAGPKCLVIVAGKTHGVVALTDAVWLCVHATDELDPERADAAVIA